MIAIASDHGGYQLKQHLTAYLAPKGAPCVDGGGRMPNEVNHRPLGLLIFFLLLFREGEGNGI